MNINSNSNVTVIIPCYNDGQYIVQALESILSQTVAADQIIIVDDGSDAATKTILKNITTPNVRLVFQENQGVSVARNVAIALATTDFIVNLDADDWYEPTFIEKAKKVLLNNQEVGMVSSYCQTFNNSGPVEVIEPGGGGVTDFIVINNGRASAMFRKDCWEQVSGFDANMKNGYEDWEFWIAVTQKGWRMYILPEVLSHYRIKKVSRDKNALLQHDFDLRYYIFEKHKAVYHANFEFYCSELLRQNSLLRNAVKRSKESREFLLGNSILTPFRFIKKFLK